MRRSVIGSLALIVALLASCAAAQDDAQVIEPFNGKDLSGWILKRQEGSHWMVGVARLNPDSPRELIVSDPNDAPGELVNSRRGGVDIYTEQEFGDCTVELEVMVAQGSNSGIYLMGNYEVQILDSWGREQVGPGDMGGLYGAAAPRMNASKEPGAWQKFVIDFQAPRFSDGKKTADALFKKITLNGKVIHENIAMKTVTGGNLGRGEQPRGPLMFQGDHGPVSFRNIRITTRP
jgi:hypothetical protein